MRGPAYAGARLLGLARSGLRGRCAARLFAFAPDASAGTTPAATAAAMATLLLLAVPGCGIGAVGRQQLLRIGGLLIRSNIARVAIRLRITISAIGVLRFGRVLALRVLMLRMLSVRVAGVLVRAHLAVAVTALLVLRGMLLLLIAAGMTVAGHGGGEALAIVHVDVGDRDFTSADSRALAFALCRHDSIIVVGMLQEILRRDSVTGCAGIACELEILLEHLIGVAAHPDIGTVAGAVE